MRFPSTHNFIAHGEMRQNDFSVPAIITSSYPLFKPGFIECKLIIKAQDWPTNNGNSPLEMSDLLDFNKPIIVSGRTDSGQDIWISKIRFNSFSWARPKIIPSSMISLYSRDLQSFS